MNFDQKQRRAEKIAHAKRISEVAATISDEEAEKLIPEEELVNKLPHPISIPPGFTEDQLDGLAKLIRKSLAAEKILAQA